MDVASVSESPRFWRSVGRSYGAAFGFAFVAPLLFAIPVVAEFVQHVVEHHIGMFEGEAAAKALENHPARIGFGYVKSLALMLVWLWIPPFMAGGRQMIGQASKGGFVKVLVFSVLLFVIQAAVGQVMRQAGVDDAAIIIGMLVALLLSFVIEAVVAPWKVAAVLGDRRVGLGRSLVLAAPVSLWAIALSFLAVFPALVLHQVLNGMMLFAQNQAVFWSLAVADSLLVGVLAILMSAPSYFVYRKALSRQGEEPVGLA